MALYASIPRSWTLVCPLYGTWYEIPSERYGEVALPRYSLSHSADRVRVRENTCLDYAELGDGSWVIIETGDGHVSGLAASSSAEEFYGALVAVLKANGLKE